MIYSECFLRVQRLRNKRFKVITRIIDLEPVLIEFFF